MLRNISILCSGLLNEMMSPSSNIIYSTGALLPKVSFRLKSFKWIFYSSLNDISKCILEMSKYSFLLLGTLLGKILTIKVKKMYNILKYTNDIQIWFSDSNSSIHQGKF